MKKIVSILTVAVLLIACMATSAFAAETVVAVDEVKANCGDTVTLNVSISGATYSAFGMTVSYPAEALELVSIEKGEACKAGFFDANVATGIVTWANNEDVTVSEATVLFTVTFKVKAEFGTHNVEVNVDKIVKADTSKIQFVVDNGHVEVAHEHVYTEEILKAPTCKEKGLAKYTCVCGDSYEKELDKLEHKWVFVEVVETGDLYRCELCGEERVEAHETGDMIGVVVALLAVSGLGITVLKKREY